LEELSSRTKRCRAVAVLATSSRATLRKELEEYIAISSTLTVCSINVGPHVGNPPLLPHEVIISSDLQPDSNGSALVVFTSGTTGRPKGVVKRRAAVYNAALAVADNYQLVENDTVLHITPVNHASGIGLALLPFLLSGGCVEFRTEHIEGFDAGQLWNRWREGGLTFFSGVPSIYKDMMQYFEEHISKLPTEELQGYVTGLNQVKGMLCGTSALPQSLQQKWTELRGGKMLLTRYGGTESSAVFKVPLHAADVPEVNCPKIRNSRSWLIQIQGHSWRGCAWGRREIV
jgi:malonyl-CoA/methylmalonyl-CoA synthetase